MLARLIAIALIATGSLTTAAIAHDPLARLAQLNRRIAAEPADARLYFERGELYRGMQRFALAVADYDQALAFDAGLSGARVARGAALFAMGDVRQARVTVEACLARGVDGPNVRWLFGECLAALGEWAAAERAMQSANELVVRPSPQRSLTLADVRARLGDDGVERAIAGLDAVIARHGFVVTLAKRTVELELDRGEPGAALARIDAILDRLDRPDAWLELRTRVAEAVEESEHAQASYRLLRRELRFSDSPTPSSPIAAPAFTSLISFGSSWSFLDDGTDQGTAWRATSFPAAAGWQVGPAPLGYGEVGVTLLDYGTDPMAKHVTYYLRHEFSVTGAASLTGARLRVLRDDGVVVYLNGVEVMRNNMPAVHDVSTLAPLDIDSVYEQIPHDASIDPTLFVNGTNVLAVELHQSSPASDDIRFDAELIANDNVATLVRGPYIQRTTSTSATIRWRTDNATDSEVWLGANPATLTTAASELALVGDHEITLTGLTPDTTYYYGVGSTVGMLAGGTSEFRFRTHPTPGVSTPVRIWAIGDSGTANADAAAVRDAYLGYTTGVDTDVWLMLGDNAYFSGFDLEYQFAVFDMYPTLLRNTCVWPTFGNHDAYTAHSGSETGAYYEIFSLPTAAEAGGLASGTEAYYSFDHGAVHFVCLDSEGSDRSVDGAMLTWLRQDLQNTSAQWVIAYWHHPPYTKGSHDSDLPWDSGGRLADMRYNVGPILEAHGVDLVLCGHSHSYERSYLLDRHYKTSSTLTADMLLDDGDGAEASDGAYTKPTLGAGAHEGAVYAVAGSSGLVSPGPLNHPAMCVSLAELGSMVIDIDGDRLDGVFLDHTGAVLDEFTIRKGVPRTLTRDVARISAAAGGEQVLTLDFGVAFGDASYHVLGSFGRSPGFTWHGLHVPLNVDAWFQATLLDPDPSVFVDTTGSLDPFGRATARIVFKPMDPAMVGTVFEHAAIAVDASQVGAVSDPVRLTIIP